MSEDNASVPRRLTHGDYDALLAAIFRRPSAKTAYAFAVRTRPSFYPESELFVAAPFQGKAIAELTGVVGQTAWKTLSDAVERRLLTTVEQLAHTIRIEHQTLDVDRQTIDDWQTALCDAVRASTQELERWTGELVLDGVTYELWYQIGMSEMRWTLPELGESHGSYPLTRWIADMIKKAERRIRE